MPSHRTAVATAFNRRTVTVLFCLLLSLSAVSGTLMVMEPQPSAPSGNRTLLMMPDRPATDVRDLVATTQIPIAAQRWQAIIIHHSAQPFGNHETIGAAHQARGLGGLAHHFVIGNGDGAEDGELQMGYRWPRQLDGAHAAGRNAEWLNKHAVGICLIGDGDKNPPTESQMRQLVRVVVALQQLLNIPPERVFLHADVAPTSSPGRFFPTADFRRQLADVEGQ